VISLTLLLLWFLTCRDVVELSSFFGICEHYIICLTNALERFKWNGLLFYGDISSAYINLTSVLHWFVRQFISVKQATITANCPPLLTPLTKSVRCKQNKLMRKNKLEKAVALSEKNWQTDFGASI
jgi:hypothetical protein